jgi:hypothetical protein
MAENAHARAADPGAAVACVSNDSTAQDSPTIANGQAAVTLPPLADARAHLLEVIRQRAEPKAAPPTRADEARWASDSRRGEAVRILSRIPSTIHVATALRVSPSTVRRWRVSACAPTVRHWRQLRALRALTWRARP